jgi:hypothetical protein
VLSPRAGVLIVFAFCIAVMAGLVPAIDVFTPKIEARAL